MDADRRPSQAKVGLLRQRVKQQAVHNGRPLELHDRQLSLRRRLRSRPRPLGGDQERLRHGHLACGCRRELVLRRVEEPALPLGVRPFGQFLEEDPGAAHGQFKHQILPWGAWREAAPAVAGGGGWVSDDDVRSGCGAGLRVGDVGAEAVPVVLVQCDHSGLRFGDAYSFFA